jgi:hypothetical protein
MREAIHPLPQYVFMAWYLVKYRDNFTFYLTIVEERAVIRCVWSEGAKPFKIHRRILAPG